MEDITIPKAAKYKSSKLGPDTVLAERPLSWQSSQETGTVVPLKLKMGTQCTLSSLSTEILGMICRGWR